jgi:hypothetical protein
VRIVVRRASRGWRASSNRRTASCELRECVGQRQGRSKSKGRAGQGRPAVEESLSHSPPPSPAPSGPRGYERGRGRGTSPRRTRLNLRVKGEEGSLVQEVQPYSGKAPAVSGSVFFCFWFLVLVVTGRRRLDVCVLGTSFLGGAWFWGFGGRRRWERNPRMGSPWAWAWGTRSVCVGEKGY